MLRRLILSNHAHGTDGIVFVDGWTGKGAITGELSRTLKDRPGYPEQPRLVVLADPCGCAWLAASDDDWLILFGIMGAPVSGLISALCLGRRRPAWLCGLRSPSVFRM